MRVSFVLMLLSIFGCTARSAFAAIEYSSERPVSHSIEVPGIYLEMLKDYQRYAEAFWHAPQPGLGYWGTGLAQGGDHGIRQDVNTVLVYALLYHEGDHTFALEDRVFPAIRWLAGTYVNGPLQGTDKKQWAHSWQSAMWAGTLGQATWLVRERLDAPTLAAAQQVVAAEADRFIDAPPPTMEPGDTRAEENAWNLTAPAAALLLMPHHAHAAGWREALIRYAFNTLSVPADGASQRVIDGKPLREWVTTTQLYPDFTLENHGFFHPTYMMIAPGLEAVAAADLRLANMPVPNALKHNVLKQWKMLQYITLADGSWLFPQGQDWDLHSYEQIVYWAMLAAMYRKPAGALLERRAAGYLRRRQRLNRDGRFVGDMSPLGFTREAAQVERVAQAYLIHKAFGPPPESTDADWNPIALKPVRAFLSVGFVVHHFPRGIFSFSWKNHLMGLALPQSQRPDENPYVTTPMLNSLVGTVAIAGQDPRLAGRFHVRGLAIRSRKEGFFVALDTSINDGLIRQQIAVASTAPGILAYVDRLVAQKDVRVVNARGLTIAVENDYLNGNQRQVSAGDWTAVGGEEGDHALPGLYANIDGRLGLVSALGDGLLYHSAGKPNRPGAREDLLIGSHIQGPVSFTAGAVVAERAGMIILDSSAAETAAVAASTRVTRDGDGLILTFTSPNGQGHSLHLATGGAQWDGVSASPAAPRRHS